MMECWLLSIVPTSAYTAKSFVGGCSSEESAEAFTVNGQPPVVVVVAPCCKVKRLTFQKGPQLDNSYLML